MVMAALAASLAGAQPIWISKTADGPPGFERVGSAMVEAAPRSADAPAWLADQIAGFSGQ
jgi:hypothetical protein